MKKILLASAIVATLTGCSSSDPAVPTPEEIAHALLNGTWLTACRTTGVTSITAQFTMNNGAGNKTINQYANMTCVGAATPLQDDDFSYTFGADVTVDGSVAGITTAKEIDMVFPANTERFGLYAIDNLITLYISDGGTDLATRPTQLTDFPYTIQP